MQAVAIDIGTSGIRAQLLDLGTGSVLRTRMTDRNPIPGANVMDHMSFAIDYGLDLAHNILLNAIRDIVEGLSPSDLRRIAVCGNPIQLSLFEGIEIRDLAYAGENKLRSEGVERIDRIGHVIDGGPLGFPGVEVVIPPAVRHEIGADALAMMLKSGFLDDDMCMVTDYGTNAEMALKVGDRIFTGSAAAGPAMEGQQIRCGMLAGPGAVSDMVRTPTGWRTKVLDDGLVETDGPLINLRSDMIVNDGVRPKGITGTGVVALIYAAMQDSRIEESKMRNAPIRIQRGMEFSEADFKEAGKAIGAIRAGHLTLMLKAGIDPQDIRTMYMAGASGTYVDPVKSKKVGLIIPDCTVVKQVGNTSIELAKDLARDPGILDELNALRDRLVTEHTMFASSDVFSELYVLEFGYWTEGMPLNRYRRTLERYGAEGYLDRDVPMTVERVSDRDIRDIGESLEVVHTETVMKASWDCGRCMTCVKGCPEQALGFEDGIFAIDTGRCLGTACQRCAENCPGRVYDYSAFSINRCARFSFIDKRRLRRMASFFENRKALGISLWIIAIITIASGIACIISGITEDWGSYIPEGVDQNLNMYCIISGIGGVIGGFIYLVFATGIRRGMVSIKIDILAGLVRILGLVTIISGIFDAVAFIVGGGEFGAGIVDAIVSILIGALIIWIAGRINDDKTDIGDVVIWVIMLVLVILMIIVSFLALIGLTLELDFGLVIVILELVANLIVDLFALAFLLDREVRDQMGL